MTFNKLYRVPVDANGKAGKPVDIWLDKPIKGPDGMRAANGKLFLAENAAGKVDVVTVTGDTASVTVLQEGLSTPTAIEPFGTRSGTASARPTARTRCHCRSRATARPPQPPGLRRVARRGG